ncbi:MAG: alpha/beta fold hydrolase [Fimbriimonadaceae bacterium]|nr:alpha/beta fold hydrolase [Fimbriimonadaceae bacterium]
MSLTLLSSLIVSLSLLAPLEPEPLPRRGTLGASFSQIPPDRRASLSIPAGQGVLVQQPVAGLTTEKAGLKLGDVLVAMNGEPVATQGLSKRVRSLRSGDTVTFQVIRDGKTIELRAPLSEKPRDPGNENYQVTYHHIVSNGQRMRTIISTPRKPGKYPGFFFIQGFSPLSYDYVMAGEMTDLSRMNAPILHEFANSGFVTIRVEKPGVGDSEGGPFAEVDYLTELDIYLQTLKQLKEHPQVDLDNIFIFGHSMGGAFGPMIASESPVKGLVVYGVASRTWVEYFMDITRYQSLLAGASHEAVDESVRAAGRLANLIFLEGKSVEDVKMSHPELAQAADSTFPGGKFSGKTNQFWAQLAQINMPKYWKATKAHVLAVKGASDYVVYEVDHTLIADTMNRVKPGTGKAVVLPNSDHIFNNWATEKESQLNWPRGTYNHDFCKLMMGWIRETIAKN